MGTGESSLLSKEDQLRGQTSISFPPSVAERYEILTPVGKGAFGTVYKVRDTKTKIIYAMKQMEYNENNRKEVSVNLLLQMELFLSL